MVKTGLVKVKKTVPHLAFDMQHSVWVSAGAGIISQIADNHTNCARVQIDNPKSKTTLYCSCVVYINKVHKAKDEHPSSRNKEHRKEVTVFRVECSV